MKIILLGSMPAIGADLLREFLTVAAEIVVLSDASDVARDLDAFDEADVIVGGPVTPQIVERAGNLKLFHVFRGGIDGLGVELLPSQVKVANTFHHEMGVAEFAVTAMLVLTRKVVHYDVELRKGNWKGSVIFGAPPDQTTLLGKTAMIVGLGRIGCEIAKRARSFGMHLVAVSRRPNEPTDVVDERVGYDKWLQRLGEADYVLASCRLAPETTVLFNREVFARMKPTACFINVARGQVVDEEALYNALKQGKIAGAASDVWSNLPKQVDEPCFPSKYPIHELPNVLLSPNRSSWTWQMIEGRMRDVAENVACIAEGRPIINDVRTQEL